MKKALVLAFALVLGLGIAEFAQTGPTLTGTWDTTLTFGFSPTFNLSKFVSNLDVTYTVGSWTFTSKSKFDQTGWTDQEFDADGNLGAFHATSAMKFNPATPAFTSWKTTDTISIAGVDLKSVFLLEPDGSGSSFTASTPAGSSFSVTGTLYMNLDSSGNLVQTGGQTCFCYTGASISVTTSFGCLESVTAKLDMNQSGFHNFSVSGNIGTLSFIPLKLGFKVDFGLTSKTVSISTAQFNVEDFGCFTLLYGWTWDNSHGLKLQSLDLYGWTMETTIGGVDVGFYTLLDPSIGWTHVTPKYSITLSSDYFEAVYLGFSRPSCCGGKFDFDTATFFSNTGGLFGWGQTQVHFSVGVTDSLTMKSGLTVDSSGISGWSLGFNVKW